MKKLLWLLLGLSLLAPPLAAQIRLQVVTQTIDKEWSGIRQVVIQAKKADVIVRGWNKPGVSVQIRRVAKHPDRAVAETELTYLLTDARTDNGTLTLTNSFRIPQSRRTVQSQLKAVFELWVPEQIAVQLSNSYGDMSLTDLRGELSIAYEFGRLTLNGVRGKTTIRSEYGDLDGTEVGGQLSGKADKADISLRQLSGTVRLECRYGKLFIRPDERLQSLNVTSTRTEIYLYPQRVEAFQYALETTYSTLNVPAAYETQSGQYLHKKRFDLEPAGTLPRIRVQGSYSPISLTPAGELLIKN